MGTRRPQAFPTASCARRPCSQLERATAPPAAPAPPQGPQRAPPYQSSQAAGRSLHAPRAPLPDRPLAHHDLDQGNDVLLHREAPPHVGLRLLLPSNASPAICPSRGNWQLQVEAIAREVDVVRCAAAEELMKTSLSL